MPTGSADPLRWIRPTLFALALLPLAVLLVDAATDGLGADPVESITHRTGWWALALLLTTLAITPIRRLTGWNRAIRLRRMLGLFAFFYATLHLATYIVLDQFFGFAYMVEDVLERPYITAGFTAWLLLLPLALTSTKGWIRRLGRRWQRLHRLVYVAAVVAVVHFVWLVKADLREPLIFAAVLAVLLGLRLAPRRSGARAARAVPLSSPSE